MNCSTRPTLLAVTALLCAPLALAGDLSPRKRKQLEPPVERTRTELDKDVDRRLGISSASRLLVETESRQADAGTRRAPRTGGGTPQAKIKPLPTRWATSVQSISVRRDTVWISVYGDPFGGGVPFFYSRPFRP